MTDGASATAPSPSLVTTTTPSPGTCALLETLDLQDVTLVGFSMGGGEVARYFTLHGADRIRSVMFASAVSPFLMQGDNNPTGPLTKDVAATMTAGLTKDETTFYDDVLVQAASPHILSGLNVPISRNHLSAWADGSRVWLEFRAASCRRGT